MSVYLPAEEFDLLPEYSCSIPTVTGLAVDRVLKKSWKGQAANGRWFIGRFVVDEYDPTYVRTVFDWLERLAEEVDPRPV